MSKPYNRHLNSKRSVLRVYNSLSSKNDEFVTIRPNTGLVDRIKIQLVSWYACGPTVYSSAHLGHARTYMTFDIIRRILQNYFSFGINYVMNITDIDDKIILKARRNYLLDSFQRWFSGEESQNKSDGKKSLFNKMGDEINLKEEVAKAFEHCTQTVANKIFVFYLIASFFICHLILFIHLSSYFVHLFSIHLLSLL